MSRTRETKVTLPCSQDQKTELERRAREQGLSIANYLRSMLDWPLEQQGSRKDLATLVNTNAAHEQPAKATAMATSTEAEIDRNKESRL